MADEFKPISKKEDFVERRNEINILKDKIKLLELIIERYKSTIEQSETKTIADIKAMVNPKDPEVIRISNEIKSKFKPYIYERDFISAAKEAHETIRRIRTIRIPIDFWLSPKDIIKLRGGDPMDKAVFLCSILIALDNYDSFVIVGIDDGTKVAVSFKFNDVWYFLDPTGNEIISGKKEELLEKWMSEEKEVYEFNNLNYNQIKGGTE
ncbi:MAG: hypothetical protein NZ903_01345 [Candidatus Micrarchaeota archaeon]|nr:hypothetical protein [Candidatus Micrarchaeota archaeon]